MTKFFHRRQIIKLFIRIGFSIVSVIFGSKIVSNKKNIKIDMNAIKKITVLPKIGPWPTIDPFLFCIHHNDTYPKAKLDFSPDSSLDGRNLGNDFSNLNGWNMYHGKTIPGFPKHPHRGFETLTVVEKGIIDHSDSLGATARYGQGDAQWLTAGDGINHSEMFPLFNQKKQNKIDFFQIWINLPSINKRVKPNFEIFWSNEIPKIKIEDKTGIEAELELICGEYEGIKAPQPPLNSWARNQRNNMGIWIIRIKKNGEFILPKSNININRSLYILKNAQISLNNSDQIQNSMVELFYNKNVVLKNRGIDTKILLLQGKAINEPIFQYGPFVMNTRDEINQAFEDYHRTEFGGWKWDHSNPVHGKFKGRFAKQKNGKLIKPS